MRGMRWFWLIAIALSPAILYAIALITAPFWRARCPACRRLALKVVGHYKWSGRECGGAVTFYQCQLCQTRLKHDLTNYSVADDEEWRRHVDHKPAWPAGRWCASKCAGL